MMDVSGCTMDRERGVVAYETAVTDDHGHRATRALDVMNESLRRSGVRPGGAGVPRKIDLVCEREREV